MAETTTTTPTQTNKNEIKSEIAKSGFTRDTAADRRIAAHEGAKKEMAYNETIMSAKTKKLYEKVLMSYGNNPPEEAEFKTTKSNMMSVFSGSYPTLEVDKETKKAVYRGTWMFPGAIFMKPKGFEKGFRMSCLEAVRFKNVLVNTLEQNKDLVEFYIEFEKDIQRAGIDDEEYDTI